jgi:hypothetical protein
MSLNWYNSYNKKVNLQGNSVREQRINQRNEFFLSTFKDAPEYFSVGLGSSTNLYDTWIYTEKAYKHIPRVKKLILAPYQNLNDFFTGQYMYWNELNEIWLLTSTDKRQPNKPFAEIKECNNNMRWVDSFNNIIEYPCVIMDNYGSDFDFNNNIVLPEGTVIVKIQQNDDTKNIKINNRFLFGGIGNFQAFKVTSKLDFINDGIIQFTLRKDNLSQEDDLVEGIANRFNNIYSLDILESDFEQSIGYSGTLNSVVKLNDEIITVNVIWSSSDIDIGTIDNIGNFNLIADGTVIYTCTMEDNVDVYDNIEITVTPLPIEVKQVVINPNKTELLQGTEQIYSVYKYIDNVQQIDGFDIQPSGANNSNYNLTIIDGNNFKIENLNYSNISLLITCTSLVDSSVGTISIKLRGLF